MINILCFGDSNTYGYDFSTLRFDKNTRWTGILQNLLGNKYNIINEGLNGRTTINGTNTIKAIINYHKEIDCIIIMLGTNDTKVSFNLSIDDITNNLEKIINCLLDYKILLISPILISKDTIFDDFNLTSINKAKQFNSYFSKLAKKYNLLYLDASKYAKPCKIDGLHLDAVGHKNLAEAIYNLIKKNS